MKIKIDQTRTYDGEGFRKRAACLCFRDEKLRDVLLVSSSQSVDSWIVPGGGLEPDEEPETAALREVDEEAGVEGRLVSLLGTFENKDRRTRTNVYVLIVENLKDDFLEAKTIGRRRKWFSLEEACEKLAVNKPVQKEYLRNFITNSHLRTNLNSMTIENESKESSSILCING